MSNSWCLTPLSKCLSKVIDYRGRTPKKLGHEWASAGYRALSANNVKFSGLDKLDSINYADEILYKKWMKEEVNRGDLLLTSEAPSGQVMLWDSDEKIVLSQRLYALRTSSEIDPVFLKYFLQSPSGQKEIFRNNSGSTVAGISAKTFDNIFVRHPNEKDVQQELGRVLYALDKKIDCNNRINAKLEAMAKTLYDYWFVQFDFPDANGKPYKSSGGKMVYNAILKREIPDRWRAFQLNDLFQIRTDSITSSDVGSDAIYTPIDSLPMKKMSFGVGQPSIDANTSLILYKANDILIGAMRVYFHRVCIAPFDGITRTTVLVLRPKEPNHLPYLYQVCNEDRTINVATKISVGTQQPYVNWEDALENYAIQHPDDDALIQKYSSKMVSVIREVINRERENAELARLRDWLLPMLMNGQVTVA
ncbi:MAG: restriction endonuclease subunit S [Rugosibacter sp.]|nr:restriction endonuclease subunit S [Rugosibacter sp.]